MQKTMHSNNGRRGPCVHVLSGRVDGPKPCMFNFECYHCAYDQWLDHMDEAGNGRSFGTGTSKDSSARCVQAV
jgi:hypothetical protein